jgi:hypothetical protein
MRHRHALYLSEAMTQRLQIMAETHGVAKSEILERALKRYLANESGDSPADLLVLQQESNKRSFRRLERDLAIATELIATFVRFFLTITPPLAGERTRSGASTWSTPVRSGDRGHRQTSSDRSRLDRAGHGNFGRDTARDNLGRPISGR